MMDRMKRAWAGRSRREQWMLGVMFALLGATFLWFGLVVPIDRAQHASRQAMLDAADRNAAMRAAAAQLKSLPPTPPGSGAAGSIDQFVGQSAGEAGLTLERAQAQGSDRMEIAIASVRPVALFSWIAALEQQGVRIETMSARPGPTAGSLSVQAVMVRGAGQ